MSTLDRRSLALGLAALPAAASSIAFAAEPDPIFAAIEARKLALARWDAVPANDEEAYERAGDADAEATRRIFRTVPTTLAGVLAILRYTIDCQNRGDTILETYAVAANDEDGGVVGDVFLETLATAVERLTA